MPLLTQPAFGPRTSLIYITAGALIDVWVAVYYFLMYRPSPEPHWSSTPFWLVGLFLTGITLLIIGLLLGRIGQEARKAELPPSDAAAAEAGIQQAAAANPNPAAAAAIAPGMMAPGMVNPMMVPGMVNPQMAGVPVAPAPASPPAAHPLAR